MLSGRDRLFALLFSPTGLLLAGCWALHALHALQCPKLWTSDSNQAAGAVVITGSRACCGHLRDPVHINSCSTEVEHSFLCVCGITNTSELGSGSAARRLGLISIITHIPGDMARTYRPAFRRTRNSRSVVTLKLAWAT